MPARDPYRYYRIEAAELAQQLTAGLAALRDAPSREKADALLRAAHTLKGASHVVKLPEIAALAHELEGELAPAVREGAALDSQTMDRLVAQADRIAALVAAVGEQQREQAPPVQTALKAVEEPLFSLRIPIEDFDGLVAGVEEALAQAAAMRGGTAALDHASTLAHSVITQMHRGNTGQAERSAAMLGSLLAEVRRGLERNLALCTRELAEVQNSAGGMRLSPIRELFFGLERTVRDGARASGKQVEFIAEGGEERVDPSMIGVLRDALIQLVRNAVAHGIEVPATRTAAGKPATGLVKIVVRREGRSIRITTSDDGAGVDFQAVRRAAVDRGLLRAEDAERQTAERLTELLLAPGLTTASVSQLAGRGIGLDIVSEAARRLKGSLHVSTAAGRGTSVEISVPVFTLATEALLCESGGRTFAISNEGIVRVLRFAEAESTASPGSVQFEGDLLDLYLPSALLGQPEPAQKPRVLLIADGDGRRIAIGADRVTPAGEVVVRALPPQARISPVIAGICTTASGEAVPVIDPRALAAQSARAEIPERRSKAELPPVLVIDDSTTTRMLEQSVLETAGYRVDVAASAEEGLEKARLHRYSLFLVDVEMPGMNGFEFVRLTREDTELKSIPAILVTSRNAPEDRQRGMAAGAADYIVKSDFDQQYLLDRIAELTS